MKKVTVPIIIAAILIIAAVVAVIFINKNRVETERLNEEQSAFLLPTDDEVYPSDVAPKSGTYYLDGDKNADLWLEVNSDFLQLKGKDLDAALRKAVISKQQVASDVDVSPQCEELRKLYCVEKDYLVTKRGSDYVLTISRDDKRTDRKSLKKSDNTAALKFNADENSITLGTIGRFILAE